MNHPSGSLLLVNANVLTLDNGRRATGIAIRNGRILAIGDSQTLRKDVPVTATVIDLEGRTVIPAFTDAHAHVWKMGHLLTTMLDLRHTASIDALLDAVAVRNRQLPPGQWLLGRGFNEIEMVEHRRPVRQELDRVASNRPVVLIRTCGHIYAANSTALKLAGIDARTPLPPGGLIELDRHGEPTGLLHETAMGLINRVLPAPTHSDYEHMITAALRRQLSFGITASSDCGVTPELLNIYIEMDARSALPARVSVMPLRCIDGYANPAPLPKQHLSPMLRVDTVKFLADGGLSGATAALSVPYRHANTTGTLRFQKEELQYLCQESHDGGWRIAIHAIGDVAIDLVLSVYETLGQNRMRSPHRIEHFALPDSRQLRRAAALGLISVPQAIFIHALGDNFIEMVPECLFSRTYPIRSMLDAGLIVALSSDAPVVDDENPLLGMYAAVTRRTKSGKTILPAQAITVEEALYGHTVAGAIASGDEQERGVLAPGKWADMAVLSADPLAVEPEALPEIRVDMTFLAGNKVYER